MNHFILCIEKGISFFTVENTTQQQLMMAAHLTSRQDNESHQDNENKETVLRTQTANIFMFRVQNTKTLIF
ncbi:unnamed protein product [Clavelina lepadiformis]|uniref:Uncharacterized protein n=1 Tax=Clavelina lepadiformis TaxID=159417 RepID=A0ABP0GAK0_CLALP